MFLGIAWYDWSLIFFICGLWTYMLMSFVVKEDTALREHKKKSDALERIWKEIDSGRYSS